MIIVISDKSYTVETVLKLETYKSGVTQKRVFRCRRILSQEERFAAGAGGYDCPGSGHMAERSPMAAVKRHQSIINERNEWMSRAAGKLTYSRYICWSIPPAVSHHALLYITSMSPCVCTRIMQLHSGIVKFRRSGKLYPQLVPLIYRHHSHCPRNERTFKEA